MTEEKIVIDGISINFKVSGKGEPVLILHGWGGSSDSWTKVIERLAEAGFKIICPDLPGFGKSDFPPQGWTMMQYLRFIIKIMNYWQLEQVYLLGHSFGGGLALKFSVMYPEKVKKLILCAPAVIRKKRMTLRQKTAFFLAKTSYWLFGKEFIKNKLYSLAQKITYKIAGANDYYLAKGVMKETFRQVTAEDLSYILKDVSQPTLVIWGRDDRALPVADAYFIHNKLNNGKIEVYDNADHSPHLKMPEKLAESIIRFLKP